MWKDDNRINLNALAPELSAQCTVQKTHSLNGHHYLHVLGYDFSQLLLPGVKEGYGLDSCG
jgi:hypothetical protein